ncbi:MAG: hypothetical protein AAF985_10310 [Bacteroidota bacterium]
MMKNEKEQWMDEVFASLKGSKRAKPPADLLAKIEQQLDAPEAKIIPMARFRVAIAAAMVLLVVNVLSLYQYQQKTASAQTEWNTGEAESLISDYKLYDL